MNIQDEKQNNIVWLETKFNDVKKDTQPDGTEFEYEDERLIYHRHYIPNWLDAPLWLQDNSDRLRLFDPDDIWHWYNWGRSIRDISKGYDPTYGLVTLIE
jgi:hypothetical protein